MPDFVDAMFLLVGVIAGFTGAHYRSRRDMALLRMHVDTHFDLAHRQYVMQLDEARESHRRKKLEDAYDNLAHWLIGIERTIDEIWIGCSSGTPGDRERALQLVAQWPRETFGVPPHLSPAQLYWSSRVREDVRRLQSTSLDLISRASHVFTAEEKAGDLVEPRSRVWEARTGMLLVLDDIRDRVRADLGLRSE